MVEAAGEIVDIELVRGDHTEKLHQETQKLLDKTPGLHRRIARHLALDANPELAGEYDELQKNQLLIKAEIKRLQDASGGKLSFRDAWSRVQKSHPQWFENLEAA